MKIPRWWAAVGLFAFAGAASASGTTRTTPAQAAIAPVPTEQTLRVTGRFGPHLESRLLDWLNRYPDTRVLAVRSPGGMRWQALQVAELVNARGITVRIEGRCASACALLWAAAHSREMDVGASLGLHGSRLPMPLPLPAAVRGWIIGYNDRQTDRVLRGAGFPERMIEQGRHTPPSTMSWFDAAELRLGGVPFVLRENGRNHG
ncbi:MAG: hypothetical protein KY442_05520 [Proteobacteria bacterium]|nr:hypothetical protein [Pseudomonadota bacterium]